MSPISETVRSGPRAAARSQGKRGGNFDRRLHGSGSTSSRGQAPYGSTWTEAMLPATAARAKRQVRTGALRRLTARILSSAVAPLRVAATATSDGRRNEIRPLSHPAQARGRKDTGNRHRPGPHRALPHDGTAEAREPLGSRPGARPAETGAVPPTHPPKSEPAREVGGWGGFRPKASGKELGAGDRRPGPGSCPAPAILARDRITAPLGAVTGRLGQNPAPVK